MNEEQTDKITLDLSKKNLKKVPKQEDAQHFRILILDENDLQKIDNIDSYLKIEKLSLSKNQLLRMYGVCRLHCLKELNLSYNGILTIEGLKELTNLTHLNLEGNNIKTIEHLNTNINLEYLNLSVNSIGSISDISFLKCLKELNLHGNRLTHLRQCDKYLPVSLQILKLDNNSINDLNEICTLSNLCNLVSITINDNPCVQMTAGADGFDHRPFVLNWCMSVKVIDGFMVDPIESLKAEWLYSQGRGRQFRVGEQVSLAKYLSSVCPMLGKALENENDRKLRLILSKAQQHQRQLQEESTDGSNTPTNNSPSSSRKKTASRIQSPRFSRMGGRQGSPDSMTSSYHGNTSSMTSSDSQNQNHLIQMSTSLIENIKNDSLMSQSYDGSYNSSAKSYGNSSQESTPRTMTPNQYNDQSSSLVSQNCGPLAAASKMVPVPETLMSPDCCPSLVAQRATVSILNHQMNHTKPSKPMDNKVSSPKVRSPHLKRASERSPTKSPRKNNNTPNNTPRNNNEYRLKSRVCNSINVKLHQASGNISTDDDDSDHINIDKLKTIRNKAAQRSQQQKEIKDLSSVNLNQHSEASAILIQKIWRGFHTRRKTKYIAEQLLKQRTNEYIERLAKDMESTKALLESERKIQQLQMQAINALWKKVSTIENGAVNSTSAVVQSNNGAADTDSTVDQAGQSVVLDNPSSLMVRNLTKTCAILSTQVEQLQASMQDIVNYMSFLCNQPQEIIRQLILSSAPTELKDSLGTQTEIVAVHTPQVENFPFKVRPSSLPLDTNDATNRHLSNQILNEKDESLVEKGRTSASEKFDDVQEQSEEDKLNADNLIISKEAPTTINISCTSNQSSEC